MPQLFQSDLIPIMQTAVGPVILISGVGLLLLTFTNRLGRTIDRVRSLADGTSRDREIITEQLNILWSRARILRASILLASMRVLLAAMLIITLFLSALLKIEMGIEIAGFFIGSMLCLIAALAFFIKDINKSLEALKLDLTGGSKVQSK